MKRILIIIAAFGFLCLPGLVQAEDIDIYGGSTVSVPPNVLIIFDNSGSMKEETDSGIVYDYYTDFKPYKYSRYKVYRKVSLLFGYRYDVFANHIDDITCAAIKNKLITDGYALKAGVNSKTFACAKSPTYDLYLGNWLNFDAAGGGTATRLSVAQKVIKEVVSDPANAGVRFGLMKFKVNNETGSAENLASNRYKNGGEIVIEIGSGNTEQLRAAIDNLNADTWTPLAETLAEAGLYFAGKQGWYNNRTYTSPIQYRCQKNYIIYMTDGEPTHDDNNMLVNSEYILPGKKIGDYNKDKKAGKLDDVAAFLFENDLRPDMGVPGESFERQNVITYTVGFHTDQVLLAKAAAAGGGQYFTSFTASGLSAAFQSIMASIADVNAVFVSPVVPVSRMNRTFAGNSLYVGFFKPQPGGRWDGNIKKYGLDSNGNLLDSVGKPATLRDGAIRDNAQSYWSTIADGPDVLAGGVGGLLLSQGNRNLYTYLGGTSNLYAGVNAFSVANTGLTKEKLELPSDATPADRNEVINDIYGGDRDWILGDILHSQPAVVHYDTNGDGILDDAYIFAGANDGVLHAFLDSTGYEKWGFIPPGNLGRLQDLRYSGRHEYFVDGAPVVYEGANQKILFFGERRGSQSYYALDITTPHEPKWMYQIPDNHLEGINGEAARLGQSWGTPVKGKIKTSNTTSETVFILGGGYDENQDRKAPLPTGTETEDPREPTDTVGRAVFSVNVATGAVSKLNFNAGNVATMTHCITDVSAFDSKAKGYLDRVYAGDLGGNIFAFQDSNGDGNWTWRKLFSASAKDGVQRKIMYAPDMTLEKYGDLIFFGTGDREDPEDTHVVNRIYAVKNDWLKPENFPVPNNPTSFVTLNENDLVDVTDNLLVLGNETQRVQTREALLNSKGWFIRLENPGEKVTAAVTLFAKVLYFTTYSPETGGPPASDPCEGASGRGQARLYAVDYLTGAAVYDWSNVAEFTGDGDPTQVTLGKKDRSKLIGTSIPSAPVIAVLPGGARLYIGVEGGVAKEDPAVVTDVNTYYWRQLNK